MLFPKSKESTLSPELFQNPGSEYRGTPFWSWNCQLQKDELLWQLEMMKQMGMGGAHFHVRTGMQTPYLSDEHMDLVKACVDKCREEGMKAWLYDEDRWPSGAAGGYVTKDKKYRAQHLLFTTLPYDETTKPEMTYERHGAISRANNGQLIACFDIVLDEQGCLESATPISPEDSCRGDKWYVYHETSSETPWFNYQTYVDTLSPAAMQRFVDITHERYLQVVGEDFGDVIPAIFTDEPQHTHKQTLGFAREQRDVILPWTADIPETFQKAYGEDLLAKLPELIWELPERKVSQIRYQYHDHIAQRFSEAFAGTLGNWCEKHGLMLTGHMMWEDSLTRQTKPVGEVMRALSRFQLPGIDMLCNKLEYSTAKQAQSVAHQYGRDGVLSELYGVTGWDHDFRGHKFQGDWQAAMGVCVRVPHLAWVSMKGEAKRDYPAAISYQSPWWKDYSYVEDHFARVNTALTRGTPDVRVGVIHPIETYWLHWGPDEQTSAERLQLDAQFQNITTWLLQGCVDYDYISEALLNDLCPVGGAPLQVGQMAYDAVIVPGCETLRSTTLERLEAFVAAGGKLIFLGDAPKYENALVSNRGRMLYEKACQVPFTRDALWEAIEPVRSVEVWDTSGVRASHFVHQLRRDGNDRWLFLARGQYVYHSDIPQCQDIRILLNGCYSVQKYDTITGQILPVSSQISDGKTIVTMKLYDLDSLLLRYTPATESVRLTQEFTQQATRPLPVPKQVCYELDEDNVYLMDKAEYAMDDAPYESETELLRADDNLRAQLGWHKRQSAMAQPWVIAENAPQHKVRLRFRVYCAQEFHNIRLALEDADIAQILCNGQPVTAAPQGWFTDKSIGTVNLGSLKQGENTIEISLPFGKRTNVEWCYLLGDFGVRVCGEYRELIPRQNYLGFDDITHQGLAHYGGNITYRIPVTTQGGKLRIYVPHYAGVAVRAEIAGQTGYIAYAPYELILDNIPAGEHCLKLHLLGHRHNCFGPLHNADPMERWIGPNIWRTTGIKWTESYRLKTVGITSAPTIEEIMR